MRGVSPTTLRRRARHSANQRDRFVVGSYARGFFSGRAGAYQEMATDLAAASRKPKHSRQVKP